MPKQLFQKGNKKAGSRKGIPNKMTVDVKNAIMKAYEKKGGVSYLASLPDNLFVQLFSKCIPNNVQLTGDEGGNNPIRLFIEGYSDRNNKATSTSAT
jgi:hypothetical protein